MTSFDEPAFFDLLYSACEAPALWTRVIEDFADAVGGSTGFISCWSLIDSQGPTITARMDPAIMDLYARHFASRNPLNKVDDARSYARDWKPLVTTDEHWLPKEDLIRTEYYNDFMILADAYACMMVRLSLDGNDVSALNITRPPAAGRFDCNALETARRLQPHLIRAFCLGRKLGQGRGRDADLAGPFSEARDALFLVDGDCRIVHANPVGERLIETRTVLSAKGCLTAPDTASAGRLRALVAMATSADGRVRGGGSMGLRSPDRALPFAIDVVPRSQAVDDVFARRSALAMVCIADLESDLAPDHGKLRELFDLTAAEARVALALLEHGDTPRAARALGLSPNTVQVHVTHIFDKTGVDRQNALVGLLMRTLSPSFGGGQGARIAPVVAVG